MKSIIKNMEEAKKELKLIFPII
jgi:hypothetical protein